MSELRRQVGRGVCCMCLNGSVFFFVESRTKTDVVLPPPTGYEMNRIRRCWLYRRGKFQTNRKSAFREGCKAAKTAKFARRREIAPITSIRRSNVQLRQLGSTNLYLSQLPSIPCAHSPNSQATAVLKLISSGYQLRSGACSDACKFWQLIITPPVKTQISPHHRRKRAKLKPPSYFGLTLCTLLLTECETSITCTCFCAYMKRVHFGLTDVSCRMANV
jgi:hypothetical protein